MPNTGKPSLDCQLCRQRRVKCDLGRPSCRRCIKYGVACPGYRDLQALVFRNVNPTTIERRKKKQQQQVSPPNKLTKDGPLIQSHQNPKESALVPYVKLTRSLPEHWTAHSLPILLNIFDLDFVQGIYRGMGDLHRGPLIWASHVFARTCFINVRNPTAVSAESRGETQRELAIYLGRALNSVSEALAVEGGAGRDDVFVTVWLLASYELLVGSLSSRPVEHLNSWHLHTRGLCSMLRSRGAEHLFTSTGRASFWPAYTMIQAECLITATPCPPESELWLQVIERTLHKGEGLALAISKFIRAVSATQCRVLEILRLRDFEVAAGEYPALYGAMVEAQGRLQEFMDSDQEESRYDSYLFLVNLQRSACVKGYHIMQLLVNFLTHYPSCPIPAANLHEHRAHCLAQVHHASQQILASAPSSLWPLGKGKDKSLKVVFEGLKIIWPLISVLTMPSCLPAHRIAARESLVYIGRELGVRQALGVRGAMHLDEDEMGNPLPGEAHRPLGGFGLDGGVEDFVLPL